MVRFYCRFIYRLSKFFALFIFLFFLSKMVFALFLYASQEKINKNRNILDSNIIRGIKGDSRMPTPLTSLI